MSDTKTIPLSRPLKTSRGELTELTMREPVVADTLAAEQMADGKGQAYFEVVAFGLLVDLAPEELTRLPLRDYKKLQDAYRFFTS